MRSLQMCLLLLLTLCAVFPNEAFQGSRSDSTSDGGVEAIYMARSMRESRVTPTKFCEQTKTGFSATIEDQYTFRSTATRPADGLLINTNVNTIGSLHACSGAFLGGGAAAMSPCYPRRPNEIFGMDRA
jgi:hypothetical protein